MNSELRIRNTLVTSRSAGSIIRGAEIENIDLLVTRHFYPYLDKDKPQVEAVADHVAKYYKGWYSSTDKFVNTIILKGKKETRLTTWFNDLIDPNRENKHKDMSDMLISGDDSRYMLVSAPFGPNKNFYREGIYVFKRPLN